MIECTSIGDSNPYYFGFMCDISMAGYAVETFTFHSYKSQKSVILI